MVVCVKWIGIRCLRSMFNFDVGVCRNLGVFVFLEAVECELNYFVLGVRLKIFLEMLLLVYFEGGKSYFICRFFK